MSIMCTFCELVEKGVLWDVEMAWYPEFYDRLYRLTRDPRLFLLLL